MSEFSFETKKFSCPNLPGFIFNYPDFKEWEICPKHNHETNKCVLELNYPEAFDFEIAPQIIIEIIPDLKMANNTDSSIEEKNKQLGKFTPVGSLKTNPSRVFYEYLLNSTDFTKDYRTNNPEPWTHLQFYGQNFSVRLQPFQQEGFGYCLKVFLDEVIKSFKFTA